MGLADHVPVGPASRRQRLCRPVPLLVCARVTASRTAPHIHLFGLAGWSKGEIARLVNRRAAAMGHLQLAIDTAWVRGRTAMGEIPRRRRWWPCSPSVSAVS
ncbi:hypothetical protein ALMP_57600 [Streptomyces sp. A012304]|nr:hypothetical protein ALMP_57600 [Streptomyces sp. A012304]